MLNWKHFGKVHQFLYRLTYGRIGARMGWIDVALVETVGRKSGQVRSVPDSLLPLS
ncbi:MAG: nitroreductase/quinone reductase family protein [Halioglobus sp.]